MNLKKILNNGFISITYQHQIYIGYEFDDMFKYIYYNNIKTHYVVNRLGQVFNTKSGKEKKLVKDSGGYYRVQLSIKGKPKSFSVHRLVAEYFIYNPDKKNKVDVNHKDGDKSHNYENNLEWVTKSENQLHAFSKGLNSNKGSMNPKSKITEHDVEEIWKMIINDKNIKFIDIANKFGVSKQTISHIYHGDTWIDMYNKYKNHDTNNKSVKYTETQIKLARKLYKQNKTLKEISDATGISKGYIYHVVNNVYRKE